MTVDAAIAAATVAALRPELDELRAAVAQRAADRPALLTAAELARELRCSRSTVQRLAADGCPRVMVCDSPRYELAVVLEWLRAQTKNAGRGGATGPAKVENESNDNCT